MKSNDSGRKGGRHNSKHKKDSTKGSSKKLASSAIGIDADAASRNDDLEERIEALCREMRVPDPDELYVIPRDFDGLGNPNITQFSTTMPDGLGRWVEEADFEYTISQINSHLARAEKTDCRHVWNTVCKYLTCFTIQACQRTKMERAIIRVRNFVLHQNRDVYHPKGFHIVEPAARGLRHIEFRSITYYSMKYFLEHEDDIEVSESEVHPHHHHSHGPDIHTVPRRSVFSQHQLDIIQKRSSGINLPENA
ncbi:Golgin subfamily A member 7 [Orchesella cincta]|uniref:Ras modification protein ERF4 n=1 Tax=Orchesella cincta TaxID=48709 RepID=A0A1D2NDH4_ORCCI|nr:Golgin subfamily A member 7 [Orchesella cincta]